MEIIIFLCSVKHYIIFSTELVSGIYQKIELILIIFSAPFVFDIAGKLCVHCRSLHALYCFCAHMDLLSSQSLLVLVCMNVHFRHYL
jgi:hypothetical protein